MEKATRVVKSKAIFSTLDWHEWVIGRNAQTRDSNLAAGQVPCSSDASAAACTEVISILEI